MQYALRCNRFREQLQNPYPLRQNYKQIRNVMRNTNFEHAFFQVKPIITSPKKPIFNERTNSHLTPVQHIKTQIVDQETEITYSTELNKTRPDRMAFTPKDRLNFSLQDATYTPKKRKTHFLTVVSRLPGMSKPKKKINFI